MAFDGDLLFCSDFPAAFHNPEPQEKARRLAGLGFRVRYVTKLGIADPSPAQVVERLRGLRRRRPRSARHLAGAARPAPHAADARTQRALARAAALGGDG